MIVDDPLSLVFSHLFVRIHGIVRRAPVMLKLEGFSITGSIKIKTALYMISAAEEKGTVRPGRTTFVESSSGNLGIALSLVCQRRGYRFICITDPNVSKASLRAMRAYGAETVVVDELDCNGGYLHTRIAYIKKLLAQDSSCVWLNQYASEANRKAHHETTAGEILAEFPAPNFLFVGAGSCGTLMGCTQRFREESPATQIIAVEPVGSVLFGGTPARRLIPGLGASRRPELLQPDRVDRVVTVSEPDTIRMCHEMAHEQGLLVGGSTGSVLAAVRQLDDEIMAGASVVAVSPDLGDRYLETVYDPSWVTRNYGFDVQTKAGANVPVCAGAGK
jgi:2,3-diaminopropionate biosynthesis protein SbnA